MTFEREFLDWMTSMNQTEKPGKEIIGFWFGLFETTTGYTMYLIGSKEFDEQDDDWACNCDYQPLNRDIDLPSHYVKGKEWEDVLHDSLEIISNYISSATFRTSFLADAIAIAAGFNGGDFHRLK
ncbi:hypothetical protein N8482_00695 [Chitinophagales bacterium]|nr:hypothetical protein [Chitinophagales bacterium]